VQAEVLRAREAAEAANRELEALSYSVAHDLRAPLRGIDGFVRIVLEDCDASLDVAAREHLQCVSSNAERMRRLIDSLLELARVTRALRRCRVSCIATAVAFGQSPEWAKGLRSSSPSAPARHEIGSRYPRAMQTEPKVVVVTGASAGIGAALAHTLAKRNLRLVLVARRERELNAVAASAGGAALPVVGDVTVRADMRRVMASAIERFGQVDVLVNNAGRGISRQVSELTDEDIDEMILVNVKSVLYGVQAVLPHFKQRERGHIINISSMLGRLPLAPFRSAYSASKHALNALTASLRMELRADYPAIHVSTVSPGVVATDFGINARHGGFDSRSVPGAQTADQVAEVIADVIERPRADVYTLPQGGAMVTGYYSAEDMGEAETKPPFMPPQRSR
jgi:NADP-dependent 3-hydroxy acid dehydrogenase YdfG